MLNEKVFTPEWTVNVMLDLMDYKVGRGILNRHIIDNSCGRGDMLAVVVRRYCEAYVNVHGKTDGLADELSEYIHGIEIDEELCTECVQRLSEAVHEFTDEEVEWDVICDDAFEVSRFNGEMDYVVANPPYRKVHDFGDMRGKVKSTGVNGQGMTDVDISFLPLGMDMLRDGALMCYITPSTWATSVAGRDIRKLITDNMSVTKVINCGHEKIFEKASTYPMITLMRNSKDVTELKVYDLADRKPVLRTRKPFADHVIDGKFYFCGEPEFLREVMSHAEDDSGIVVRNGYATLNDKLFVTGGPVDGATNVIQCVKASKGTETWIVFPYDKDGRPIPLDAMDEKTALTLKNRAQELNVDTSKDGWWLYGRSQAIMDTNEEKYAVGNLVSERNHIKVKRATNGVGVYGGMYVKGVSKSMTPLVLYRVMVEFKNDRQRFFRYASALGHCKSGGYYYVNTAEVQSYINFLYDEMKRTKLRALNTIKV